MKYSVQFSVYHVVCYFLLARVGAVSYHLAAQLLAARGQVCVSPAGAQSHLLLPARRQVQDVAVCLGTPGPYCQVPANSPKSNKPVHQNDVIMVKFLHVATINLN